MWKVPAWASFLAGLLWLVTAIVCWHVEGWSPLTGWAIVSTVLLFGVAGICAAIETRGK
jgi:hypothetical protein